jgi:uncharacterized membrane protein YkvA (DUF1232 family)
VAASATPADPRRRKPDAFPREAVLALVRRMPAYARLGWALGRDPALSGGRRAAVLAAAAYVVSPIDLVPGIIPLAGQLDDAAIALLGLRFALRGLPASQRDAHLAAAGVTAGQLDQDLATVGQSAAWLVRGAGRVGVRFGAGTGRLMRHGALAAWRRFR